jgi:hypothetical protein
MDASTNRDSVATCSVTEMARKLGLSRARLYQLMETGVFPPPVRAGTRRPFYTPDLQHKCLQIHKTGVGFNGQSVLFNKRWRRKARREPRNQYDGFVPVGLLFIADAPSETLLMFSARWQDHQLLFFCSCCEPILS